MKKFAGIVLFCLAIALLVGTIAGCAFFTERVYDDNGPTDTTQSTLGR